MASPTHSGQLPVQQKTHTLGRGFSFPATLNILTIRSIARALGIDRHIAAK